MLRLAVVWHLRLVALFGATIQFEFYTFQGWEESFTLFLLLLNCRRSLVTEGRSGGGEIWNQPWDLGWLLNQILLIHRAASGLLHELNNPFIIRRFYRTLLLNPCWVGSALKFFPRQVEIFRTLLRIFIWVHYFKFQVHFIYHFQKDLHFSLYAFTSSGTIYYYHSNHHLFAHLLQEMRNLHRYQHHFQSELFLLLLLPFVSFNCC